MWAYLHFVIFFLERSFFFFPLTYLDRASWNGVGRGRGEKPTLLKLLYESKKPIACYENSHGLGKKCEEQALNDCIHKSGNELRDHSGCEAFFPLHRREGPSYCIAWAMPGEEGRRTTARRSQEKKSFSWILRVVGREVWVG